MFGTYPEGLPQSATTVNTHRKEQDIARFRDASQLHDSIERTGNSSVRERTVPENILTGGISLGPYIYSGTQHSDRHAQSQRSVLNV